MGCLKRGIRSFIIMIFTTLLLAIPMEPGNFLKRTRKGIPQMPSAVSPETTSGDNRSGDDRETLQRDLDNSEVLNFRNLDGLVKIPELTRKDAWNGKMFESFMENVDVNLNLPKETAFDFVATHGLGAVPDLPGYHSDTGEFDLNTDTKPSKPTDAKPSAPRAP
eukprot:NODE_516_length_6577_cov_0.589379.p5 type:complete len:164 gc:universal NODE_516_length_6577_cov_0.589379:1792-2283(+)